jgi:hypothetical protein
MYVKYPNIVFTGNLLELHCGHSFKVLFITKPTSYSTPYRLFSWHDAVKLTNQSPSSSCHIYTNEILVQHTYFYRFGYLLNPRIGSHLSNLTLHDVVSIFYKFMCWFGVRGGGVGWGTAQQAGRSRVRFPMVSLEFFIDITLPAALWPWGCLSL